MGTSRHISLILVVLTVACLAWPCQGFYLPGIAPIDYASGAKLEVMANKLTSPKNQLPFDYYSLGFCGSEDKKSYRSRPVNLGQLLVGERMKPTHYDLAMRRMGSCKVLCSKTFTEREVKMFKMRIHQEYAVRLNLDNMPVVMKARTGTGAPAYHFGYRIGVEQDKKHYINNHLKFTVLYNEPSADGSSFNNLELDTAPEAGFRVVGFEVVPFSTAHKGTTEAELMNTTCPVSEKIPPQEVVAGKPVTFTYDVDYVLSSTRWATRWDPLLAANPELQQIQWFSIINSLMITLFLTALVGTVLMRTVLRDFVRYNQLEDEDEADETTGWKLVHVCRARYLAAFLGNEKFEPGVYYSASDIFLPFLALMFSAGRCVPCPREATPSSNLCRVRCTDYLYDYCHSCFCAAGFSFSCESWRSTFRHAFIVGSCVLC